MFKRILLWLGKFLLGFIGFILLYLLAELAISRIPVNKDVAQHTSNDYTVYLLSNGVHTDIVLPAVSTVNNWYHTFPATNTKSQDSTLPYIAIGWGDKGFYLETPEWSQLKPRVAFNAVTGLGDAALHVTYYKTMTAHDKCIAVSISAAQLKQLTSYVLSSLDMSDSLTSIVLPTDAQYGDNDAFYEAKGSYHLFHTCNTWTNRALKAANMKACLWNTFDKGIFYHYSNN